MRAVIIEMVHVLADHGSGVSFVVDQQPVGALRAQATTPPFDETVRPRCPRRDLDSLDALGGVLNAFIFGTRRSSIQQQLRSSQAIAQFPSPTRHSDAGNHR
jgi:hypothetical protein